MGSSQKVVTSGDKKINVKPLPINNELKNFDGAVGSFNFTLNSSKTKLSVSEALELKLEINDLVSKIIGPIAKADKIQFVSSLPKTRSGKIMRRILRKIASGNSEDLGDTSTLLDPSVIDEIKSSAQ